MVFRSSPISWIRSTLMHLLGPESTGEGFVSLNCNEPASEGPAQTAGGQSPEDRPAPLFAPEPAAPTLLLVLLTPASRHVCSSLWPHISSGIAAAHALTCNPGSLPTWRMQAPLAAWRLRERTSAPSAPTPLCFSTQLILFFYDDHALQGEGDAEVCWELWEVAVPSL